MGLLKLVENVPGINYYEYRDHNYWSEYKYRARVKVPGGRITYFSENILDWRKRVDLGSYAYRKQLTAIEKKELLNKEHIVAQFLDLRKTLKHSKTGMVRTEGITAAIFSNDLAFLHSLKDWNIDIDFTEVKTSEFSGTKYFIKEPKSKFRVYLKSKRVGLTVYNELRDFLSSRADLRPSKALTEWCVGSNKVHKWKFNWISSSYFIEYNDEATITYLLLMYDDILGRKYKLEKRPEED